MSTDNNETRLPLGNNDEPRVELPASWAKYIVRMCFDVLTVLGPEVLGTRRNLLVSTDKKWVDWPSLENDLTEWMTTGMRGEEPLPSDRFEFFANGDGHISVHVEHVIEDLWSVECLPAILNDSNEWEPDLREAPALAMLEIPDSRLALPYGWYHPIS